ncbi:hypothetical protein BH10PSE6_BH10PSE6_34730 [soil metagenome]
MFVHIPKTAGTSVRNMLAGALPTAVKIFDYWEDTPKVPGDFIDAFTDGIRTPERFVELRSSMPRDQQVLVSGHIPVIHLIGAFHPASFVSLLRDPVDRIASNYRYHVMRSRFSGTFAEFLELPSQINSQSQWLQGTDLRDLGFVGLVEFMPEMVQALSRHLGVKLRMRHDNITGRSPRPTIDAAIRARILALNEDDVNLYRHVEANLDYFTNYRARRSISSKLGRGKVYRTPEGTLQGWALARDSSQLAEIELRIGGQVMQRCYADQFLPWLKKNTPPGVGGFQVRLPTGLSAGQTPIRVVIAGTEKDLEGSPLVV